MTARLMSLSPLTTLTTIHHCPIWHLGEGQTGQYLLWAQGLELLTKIRKNMKNSGMRLWDKLLLRKRLLIETINDQLKNISQIEHTRHRSVTGFMVNLVAGLIAYSYQPKKPSLGLRNDPRLPILVI